MPQATLSSLGARVLRKLGVQAIPVSQNSASLSTLTHQQIAMMALRKSGAQIVPVTQNTASVATTTHQQIAMRALRKAGAQIVSVSQMATGSVTVASADIAARALRKMGAQIVPAGAVSQTVTFDSSVLAQRALRELGIIVPQATWPAADASVAVSEIANRALRAVGVNPVAFAGSQTNPVPTISVTEIASRALRALGVNPAGPITSTDTSVADPTVLCATVLMKLGVIDPTETVTAQDLAFVQQQLSYLNETLLRNGVATWDTNSIPSRAENSYLLMLTYLCASAFGRSIDVSVYADGETSLRMQALAGQDGQSRAEAVVMAVHDNLASRAIVGWPNSAIPQSAVNAYVTLAAAMLVPVHAQIPSASTYVSGAATRAQLVDSENTVAAHAEDTLRKMSLAGIFGLSIATDKATEVHDYLISMGLVSWPSSAVPASRIEAYVAMTATLLWPVMSDGPRDAQSRQADQAAWDAAEDQMRKAAKVDGALTLAETRIADVQDELVADGVASWPLTAIPQSVADAYVGLTVQSLQGSFDGKFDPEAYAASKQRVRMVAMGGAAGVTLAQQKVAVVHEEVVANGLADWTVDTIPLSASEAYVDATVQDLATAFDMKPDPDLYAAAIRRIRMISMGGAAAEALAEQMVTSVHEEASANGLVDWTVDAVPLSASEPYVDATVAQMSEAFDRKPDPEGYDAALKRIRMIAMGGSAAEALAEQKVISAHEEATANGLTAWTLDAIPLSASEPYVDATVSQLAEAFDRKPDPQGYEAAMKRLRLIAMGGAAGQALAEQKIMAVHSQLDAEGIVRWTIYDVPDFVEEPYVVMAATLLGPEWERPVDPKWWTQGLAMIERTTSLQSTGQPMFATYF